MEMTHCGVTSARISCQGCPDAGTSRTVHREGLGAVVGHRVSSPRVMTMADIAFNCPECGRTYEFSADLAGKRGRCKSCQAVFRIPESRPSPVTIDARTPPPLPATPPAVAEAIEFKCPACGRGYRLAANLAGKPGRCHSCGGIFVIPTLTETRAAASQSRPASATPRPAAADDSSLLDLDAPDLMPMASPRDLGGRRGTLAPAHTTTPRDAGYGLANGGYATVPTALPARAEPMTWGTYAMIAAAVGASGFAVIMTIALLTTPKKPTTVANQPAETIASELATAAIADTAPPDGGSPAAPPRPDGVSMLHREIVDNLARAYNEIADGYASIRDAGTLPEGNAMVARGTKDLRWASDRGKTLPPLPASHRSALVRQAGPSLLRAVDRVLDELRRLRETRGLKGDFDRVLTAYTRTRDAIRREIDRR